jgi:hypothetical protein
MEPNMIATFKLLGVVSNTMQWLSGGILMSTVDEKSIHITLPVFVTSLIATASFTWIICKYDNQRSRDIDTLREEILEIKNSCNAKQNN